MRASRRRSHHSVSPLCVGELAAQNGTGRFQAQHAFFNVGCREAQECGER